MTSFKTLQVLRNLTVIQWDTLWASSWNSHRRTTNSGRKPPRTENPKSGACLFRLSTVPEEHDARLPSAATICESTKST